MSKLSLGRSETVAILQVIAYKYQKLVTSD